MVCFTWKAGVSSTWAPGPVPPHPPRKHGRRPALSWLRNPFPAASAEFSILSGSCSTDRVPILRGAVYGDPPAPAPQCRVAQSVSRCT